MIKMIRVILPLLVLMSFTFLPKDIQLEYKFKVGETIEWTQTAKQNIKQSIPGAGDVVVDIVIDGVTVFKVVEKTSTGAKLTCSFPKLKMSMKSPMGEMSMDSDGSQDNQQNKIFKIMTEGSFVVYLSKIGVVEKVEGLEKFSDGLNKLGLDSAGLAGAKKTMDQFASEKTIKGNLEAGFVQYPTTKVKTGATWKTSTEGSMSFPVRIDNTWTVGEIANGVAAIESEGTIATTDTEKVIELNGFGTKTNLTGRQATKTKVNTATGWPTEFKTISEVKGNLTLLAGSGIPTDMDIPMEITTESTITMMNK